MLARLSHVEFSGPLQKQYRYVSVNIQAGKDQWLETQINMTKTVLNFSDPSHVAHLDLKCVI